MNQRMMIRQRLIPTMLLLTACQGVWAQHGYTRTHERMLVEARDLFAGEQWADAAKVYKRLQPVDTAFAEVSFELATCLANMPGQRDKALPLFESAMRHGHVEATYQMANMRHAQQRFDEAEALYRNYRAMQGRTVEDAEVDRRIGMAATARTLTAAPVDVRITNMGRMVNSEAHDYCPLVTADGNTLYFTSRRQGSTGGMRDPSGQYYEDIYVAKRVDEIWSNATGVGAPLNTNVQDATVGLDAEGSRMIIYRTGRDLVSGDLLESTRHMGQWQPPQPMTERINSPAHEPSATLSPDGQDIYFTSDREGGFGGRDLYRIRRLPNGEWSKALNLGPAINTPYDEDAPFMHSDGTTLFFSSNGHNTMGGYDIFKSTLLDADMNGWSAPENLGYPLNTVNDDIYFCLSEDGQTGYFSSERSGGLGGQDIYQIVFPTSQTEHLLVRGVVTDAGEEPVKARITLMDTDNDEIVGIYNTNERTGRYVMIVAPHARYAMTVEAPGFETKQSELSTSAVRAGEQEIPLDITLTRNENTAKAGQP